MLQGVVAAVSEMRRNPETSCPAVLLTCCNETGKESERA